MKFMIYHIFLNCLRFVLITMASQVSFAESLYLEQIKAQKLFKPSDDKLLNRIKQFQARKQYVIENLPAFHQQGKRHDKPINLCQTCHGLLPHQKNEISRAFLNQHSQRIDCLTCHYQNRAVPLVYAWLEQGSRDQQDTKINNKKDVPKISPFYQKQALSLAADHPFSKQIVQQWDKADLHQKLRLQQRIHQPLKISDKKIQCADCHHKKGLLDLQQLKFNKLQIENIENNLISRFVHQLISKKQGLTQEKPIILLRGLLQ